MRACCCLRAKFGRFGSFANFVARSFESGALRPIDARKALAAHLSLLRAPQVRVHVDCRVPNSIARGARRLRKHGAARRRLDCEISGRGAIKFVALWGRVCGPPRLGRATQTKRWPAKKGAQRAAWTKDELRLQRPKERRRQLLKPRQVIYSAGVGGGKRKFSAASGLLTWRLRQRRRPLILAGRSVPLTTNVISKLLGAT